VSLIMVIALSYRTRDVCFDGGGGAGVLGAHKSLDKSFGISTVVVFKFLVAAFLVVFSKMFKPIKRGARPELF
jgi:hypothetical protein